MHTKIIEYVSNKLFEEMMLCPESEISIKRAGYEDLSTLVGQYGEAYERGDWFGGRLNTTSLQNLDGLIGNLLTDKNIIFVKFVDSSCQIIGSTLLEYNDAHGFLIDETQIHPVLGRKKGIMSAYFRRLIPILNSNCCYWTEFVLTETSRILRQVLIDEFDMVPLSYLPGYYEQPDGNRLSSLIAYGPHSVVMKELSDIRTEIEELRDFINLVLGKTNGKSFSLRSGLRTRLKSYEKLEINLDGTDKTKLYKKLQNSCLVGVTPYERKAILVNWPLSVLNDSQLVNNEGISSVTRLVEYVLLENHKNA